MRRVALLTCGLAAGAVAASLSVGLTPVKAQESPVERASLTKPAPAPNAAPTAIAALPAKSVKAPAAAAPVASPAKTVIATATPADSPAKPATATAARPAATVKLPGPTAAPVASPAEPAAIAALPPAPTKQPAATAAPVAAPGKPATATPVVTKKDACAGVIGTSRTIVANPDLPKRVGLMQFKASLPLNDHEVVLTFDDGPIHTYTARVLDTLKANCVKATFFLVGSMAHAYPALVRREYNEGHSIGTHSQHHPLTFNRMTEPAVEREVDTGIASVDAAVGDPRAVAPFFRVPGLLRSKTVDSFLAEHALMEWSADEVADDWHHGITAAQIVRLAMKRIAARGHRGVLLLHDIHPETAKALPVLLAQLKAHGYHIVHVAPAGERPKSVPPLPETLVAHAHPHKAAHHRHVARRKATKRRHAHAQSLSALAHRKKHRTHTAASDEPKSLFDW